MAKTKGIQISLNGEKAILTIDDAKKHIDSIEEGHPYVFRVVFLTEEEFNNLPKFEGF